MDTIWDEVQAAIRAGYDPTWSYDAGLAALNLGVSTKTLHRLRKIGAVRAFSIPSQFPGKVAGRFRQEDLDDFVLTHSNRKRYWDPDEDPELPVGVSARLLGVTPESLYVLKSRGKLADYQPETIRSYLQKTCLRKVAREIRRKARERESGLRAEIRRLRDKLGKGIKAGESQL
jgi:hypothetical protein